MSNFKTQLDPEDFQSCVNRAIELLQKRKEQMESEGYQFKTCLKAAKWAIEQAIINRPSGTEMMYGAIQFLEKIEDREEFENGLVS